MHTVNIGGDEHQVGFRRVHPTQQRTLASALRVGFLTIANWASEAVAGFLAGSRVGKFPVRCLGCEPGVYEAHGRSARSWGLTPAGDRLIRKNFSCHVRVEAGASNQSLNLTGAAFRFRAACSRCSGPGKLALSFGGRRREVTAQAYGV